MINTNRSLSRPSPSKEDYSMINDDTDSHTDVRGRRRSRTRRCHRKGNALFTCFLAVFVLLAGFWALWQGASLFLTMEAEEPSTAQEDRPPTGGKEAEADGTGWNLLLVNRWNPLPDQYEVDLVELPGGESVDTRIYSALQEMFDAARSEDIYPIVSDAYRTREDQQTLMDDVIQNYEDEGYSSEEASSKAEQVIAKPGTSEHETGLAIDIAGDDDYDQDTDSVLEWMNSNAYKYGFILRYPSGKESVTGAEAENDHYRYVGKEAAKVIHDQGICLEEYLSQNN